MRIYNYSSQTTVTIHYGGRIHNARISRLAKFSYLIVPKNQFTSFLIHSIHATLFYARTNSTLTAICQTYWLSTGLQYIKALQHHCVVCKRHCEWSLPASDPTPLPEVRTHDVTPFTVTGVIFTVALYVQHGGREVVYMLVHLCHNLCGTLGSCHKSVYWIIPIGISKICESKVTTADCNIWQSLHIAISQLLKNLEPY